MKHLKECLLNEVRLTIHNTNVFKATKKFGDLKPGDEFYECYLSKRTHEYSIEKCIVQYISKSYSDWDWNYFKNGSLVQGNFKVSECVNIDYIKDGDTSATYGWAVPKDLSLVLDVEKDEIMFISTSEVLIDDAIIKLQLL